mgnify:CR=1 FL=1
MWIVLPIVLTDLAWYKVLIGFFIMHYVAGLILSVVFQLAHVMDEAEMHLPEKDGTMKNTWAVHQLKTTVNFGAKNWLVNWYTGGLNHQVEHHIFSHISHIHYSKLAKIVRETAQEFSLPYNEYNTFWEAVAEHYNQLKTLGQKPRLA